MTDTPPTTRETAPPRGERGAVATADPVTTPAAGTGVRRRPFLRTGRGIVAIEGVHPAGMGVSLAITACSMVVSAILLLDFVSRLFGLDNGFATVMTDVGGVLRAPFTFISDATIRAQASGDLYSIPLSNLAAIGAWALAAWLLAKAIRVSALRREGAAPHPVSA